MKRAAVSLFLCVLLAFVTGCATTYPVGAIYTGVTLPVTATEGAGQATKVGTAQCISVLQLVAVGDASIETAKKNGGITKVHHIDWHANNVLGIVGTYKVIVYGE